MFAVEDKSAIFLQEHCKSQFHHLHTYGLIRIIKSKLNFDNHHKVSSQQWISIWFMVYAVSQLPFPSLSGTITFCVCFSSQEKGKERLYQLLKFHAMSDFTKLLTFILIFGKKCMHEWVPKKYHTTNQEVHFSYSLLLSVCWLVT